MFRFIGFVCVALVVLLPFKDSDSVSGAAKNQIVRQIPYALDILAARHPLKVGLIRSLLNEHGEADSVVESLVRTSLDREKGSNLFESFAVYYAVMFDADEVRADIANAIEKQLGLN